MVITYNITSIMVQEHPLLAVTIAVLAVLMILLTALLGWRRTQSRRLEALVQERTEELKKREIEIIEANERTKLMLDSSPLCCEIWDSEANIIDCNEATVKFFGLQSKEEYLSGYFNFSPEYQPNGNRSDEEVKRVMSLALTEGRHFCEWQHVLHDGTLALVESTLISMEYKGEQVIIAYSRDLREQNKMMETINNTYNMLKHREKMRGALNEMAVILLSGEHKTLDNSLSKGLHSVADTAALDGVAIYRIINVDSGKRFGQAYRWDKAKGGTVPVEEKFRILPDLPFLNQWSAMLAEGKDVKVNSGSDSEEVSTFLNAHGRKSYLLTPVFIDGKLWGAVAFYDNRDENRKFDETDVELLRSAAFLCVNAIVRDELEREVFAASQRLNLMLNSTPLICNIWDKNYTVIDCNKTALKYFDMEKDEYMERFLELAPEYQPDGRRTADKARELLDIAFKDGQCTFEWMNQKLDGTLLPNEVTLIRVAYGNDYVAVGFGRDLREHNKMMAEIKQQTNELSLQLIKMNLMTKAANIALWDMDVVTADPINPENTFTWSQDFRNMLGFSDEKDFPNLLHSWSDRLHPEDKESTLEAFSAHINDFSGKTPYNVEYRLMQKSGEYRYFHAFGDTIRNKEGIPLKVAGAIIDITERKMIEYEIEEANRREQEKINKLAYWYESILDATPLPITVTDLDMKWTFVNKAVEDFLNMKREDMMGKLCSNWNANICNTENCGIARVRRGFNDTYFEQFGKSHKVTVSILKNLDGEDAGYIEVVHDITEIQKLAREKAEAESKAKSDFLSAMSHEMRTPMNAIIGMTTIGKRTNSVEEKNNALNKIGDASSHLLGVINDVLDMAKIEANKLELAPAVYDFEKMLQNVMLFVNFRIDEKEQALSVVVDPQIPRFVFGDEQRLAQVITNLLANAVKFTPAGGKILFEAALTDEVNDECELCISVTDNGIGLSPEQHDRIFQAFEQAESGISREYGGTGLGLVISKRIIELMGGDIRVESELGKGAKFIFTVKVKRSEANESSMKSAEEHTAESCNFAGKRLLIAEDVEINREILISLLEETELIIDCAKNGKEALDMVCAAPDKYDIIFMDVQMPKMDGLEATRKIRDLPALQGVKLPIIAMTANVFQQDIDECIEAGMDGHIGKPIDIEKVFDILRKYLISQEV